MAPPGSGIDFRDGYSWKCNLTQRDVNDCFQILSDSVEKRLKVKFARRKFVPARQSNTLNLRLINRIPSGEGGGNHYLSATVIFQMDRYTPDAAYIDASVIGWISRRSDDEDWYWKVDDGDNKLGRFLGEITTVISTTATALESHETQSRSD